MIILDMDMPKCCNECEFVMDSFGDCGITGEPIPNYEFWEHENPKPDWCPIIAEIHDNPTNGDVFKALYPNVDIVHLIRENKRVTELSDEWWDMPYKGASENDQCEALDEENVLDKIIAEIEQLRANLMTSGGVYEHSAYGLDYAMQIIDKYKESEVEK